MKAANSLRAAFPPLILAIGLFCVYVATLAPGLSWANYGSDGGDLIAAAATNGIAHPTGYPLYLILARLFLSLPIGTLAFRTNLFSAFSTVGAALLVYGLVLKRSEHLTTFHTYLAAILAGLAFGLSPLVWSQAIITEVYGLHSFLMAGLLFLQSVEPARLLFSRFKNGGLGFLFGLAMGNHLTTIFFLPILFSSVFIPPMQPINSRFVIFHWQVNWRLLSVRAAWLVAGLLFYLVLPLRAVLNPAINWGDPVTWKGFFWLVSGRMYAGYVFPIDWQLIGEKLQGLLVSFPGQFGVPLILIGTIGLIVLKNKHLQRSLLWLMACALVFYMVYTSKDAVMYLIPAMLYFSIGIGFGVIKILDAIPNRYRLVQPILLAGLILLLLLQTWANWQAVDASKDQRAEAFITNVHSFAPSDALVFAQGDQAVFSLWYSQYALHERTDLIIIAPDLLQYEWYADSLMNTYPLLALPVSLPFVETVIASNPDRAVCFVTATELVEINCSQANPPE